MFKLLFKADSIHNLVTLKKKTFKTEMSSVLLYKEIDDDVITINVQQQNL